MEKYLNDLIELLLPMKNIFLYVFLFLSAVVENLFPPIPGDTITLFGAFLVGIRRLNYFYVYLCTTTGSVIGFMMLFFIGKFLGRNFFLEKNFKYFPVEKLERADKWIGKYGYWIIVSNRFVPGIRSFISIVSGISKLKTYIVLILATISCAIWNLIWIHVGFLLGSNWDTVKEKFVTIMRNYNIIAFIIIIILIAGILIIRRYLKKEK